ncbi:probable G-protein coupled receptor 139 [Heptranchias perlo]|uniref:probable G-protein coupled receptor 139 n=1 Tax=Heptranchias perlo TaxID=212740 RepID=UPI00355A46A4
MADSVHSASATLLQPFSSLIQLVNVSRGVAFTFDRFVAICCEKLKTKYCTEKMAVVVLGTHHLTWNVYDCSPPPSFDAGLQIACEADDLVTRESNATLQHGLMEILIWLASGSRNVALNFLQSGKGSAISVLAVNAASAGCLGVQELAGIGKLLCHIKCLKCPYTHEGHRRVNLMAIVILSRGKCGLSTCTTRYLVAMAAADLLVIITEVILWRISYYYFPGSFLDITPVCSVIAVLTRAAIDCSVWFTITFSIDRFVSICCQKLKTKYCTEETAAVILATTCILLCLKDVPFYFTYKPAEIIDNVPWDCYTKPSYYTEPVWIGFDWFNTILTPLLPFALILLLNSLTVRYILVASRVRKRLRGQRKGENRSDPEMESRRKSVILLFTISGSFVLLWLLYVAIFLFYNIVEKDPTDDNHFLYVIEQVGLMLQNLSSCTNTFIYGVTQPKFREQFKSTAKYPVTLIIKLMNNKNN